MKRNFFYLALLVGIFAGSVTPAAMAEEESAPRTEKKAKKSKSSKKEKSAESQSSNLPAVKAALKNMEFLTDTKPSAKAKYYVYLHSASWCSPCKALMPEIVKEYKKMQKKKVEIILIGHDRTADAAKAYLEHYEAGFPGIMASSPATASLPGYSAPQGIPNATIVNEDGDVLYSGHGKGVLDWKTICKPAKKKK